MPNASQVASAPSPSVVSKPVHSTVASPIRLASLDALRGFTMLLLASGGFGFAAAARFFPDSAFWNFIGPQFTHVSWSGTHLWDMIQPLFMFMVGVSLPFSIQNRLQAGQDFRQMFRHALWRSLLLICLGVFLRSIGRKQLHFTFVDVVAQIGLGYTFLFLLAWTRLRTQVIATAAILIGYWAFFALYPVTKINPLEYGLPFSYEKFSGFAAHWNIFSNPAAAFDQWFLNLFPRESKFVYQGGGYQTLNFLPALGTMALGLIAGGCLHREGRPKEKVFNLMATGLSLMLIGQVLDLSGICPSVKPIWTPAWALWSGGWAFLFLALFYSVIDWQGWKTWSFPLRVLGMNSIAIYCLNSLFAGWTAGVVVMLIGSKNMENFGKEYVSIVRNVGVLILFWLVLYWMYRRKIFLKL